VLVTGHTGFKGSWLCLWLLLMGAQVVGYAVGSPTRPALFELARVGQGMTSRRGDVRDRNRLRRTVAQYRPEIVFHMAAQAIVRESYTNPVETFATNVMGTVHLLDAVRQVEGVRAVLCITSDKCYENREWLWGYREYEAMGGYDPYSSSKGCAELVTKAYRNSFLNFDRDAVGRTAVASARAGNVIGGGDWAKDRLVPDILHALANDERIVIRNPEAVRPWQHVLDPLNGYLTLAERLYQEGSSYSESWNFGPPESNSQSVEWIVEHLLALWGGEASWQRADEAQPHEDVYLRLDSSKARIRLGWEAQLELRTALEWIVEWTRAFHQGSDMRKVTQGQIGRFVELVQHTRALGKAGTIREAMPLSQAAVAVEEGVQLLDLAPDTMMVRKVDGTITYWNQLAEQLYGWTKGEAVGHVSHVLLRTKFPKSLQEIEAELLSTGRWEGDLVHTTRDGRHIEVSSYWALKPHKLSSSGVVLEINRI
jgi:CDP-glucose 4,6-dehydratase